MSKRVKILAGNWKMNNGSSEAMEYFKAIADKLRANPKTIKQPKPEEVRRVIFTPAYALGTDIQKAAAAAHMDTGAQNVHWEEKGAFTGELSGTILKEIGIHWVLIGHSERRQYFGETDETATKRFIRAANLGLNVVYCIGEVLAEREAGRTEQVLTKQMIPFLAALKMAIINSGRDWPICPSWSVAYEPVWAIGTGKTATNEQAEQAHKHIRKVTEAQLGREIADKLPILYGGSVTPDNAAGLLSQPDVDGVLVGGASLKPDDFARILASI